MRVLRLRVLSGIGLGLPVLLVVWIGSPTFDVLIGVAAAVLSWEWFGMCGGGRPRVDGLLLAAVVVTAVALAAALDLTFALGAIAVGTIVLLLRTRGDPWITAGVIYLGLPCAAMVWLRGGTDEGRHLVLWLLAVVWATDIGAYAAGRLIGGPRLAPAISPNKTWAGLIGGVGLAAVTSAVVAMVSNGVEATEMQMPVLIGAALAVTAQGGDLAESWVKRRFGVKDASTLIPGHGGLLDRVDGLLAGILLVALIAAVDEGAFSRWL